MSLDEKDSDHPQSVGEPAPPCAMVIFGASGDLTKRKLIPALYHLAQDHLLPKAFAIVGVGLPEMSNDEFREKLSRDLEEFAGAPVDPQLWGPIQEALYYVSGDFEDSQTFKKLKDVLSHVDATHQTAGNYLYYLATVPTVISTVIREMGYVELAREQESCWRRVIFEKPFGHDLESARALNCEVKDVFLESQLYRIDHYLGKETVQNILAFRFGNGIFEPIWNRRYIDHIQITAAETVGVELRGAYYEMAGALRDMVPNHLFQLLSLTAMEPPVSFEANAVRDEQAKVLRAIRPFSPEDVLSCAVRGQYDAGVFGSAKVNRYLDEPHVSNRSTTETFVALKLSIDNWRWAGIPFFLRTGKRMEKRLTEIAIQFKPAPHLLFRKTAVERLTPNRLVLQIQPEEGIKLRFGAKVPGPIVQLGSVDMGFRYGDYFGCRPSTGYERLLYDCMCGDATLFQRSDMVEMGWSVVTPILDVWKSLPPRSFPNYKAGTWGPKDADVMLEREGWRWPKMNE